MGYRIINGIPYVTGNFPHYNKDTVKNDVSKSSNNVSFKELLEKKLKDEDTFTISNHAAERIKDINFSNEDYKKLSEGINLAKQKGCKNSVLIYKDLTFVASIENKTIITAISKERAKENVFTNIDSVLFL